MHPSWQSWYTTFKANFAVKKQVTTYQNWIESLSDFEVDIRLRKKFLQDHGYLVGDALTQKGVLASEIHESHPLLMSHAYVNRLLHGLTQDELIVCLSVFLEGVHVDYEIQQSVFCHAMENYASVLSTTEDVKSDYKYWNVTSYWEESVKEWLDGNDHIAEYHGIDPGNFVRAMLKLANIVDEWINMATITQDVEMVEKMIGARNKIVRGFVVPDSLYLRL
jgi:hypothetical protein